MPIRNPFARRTATDDTLRPGSSGGLGGTPSRDPAPFKQPSFERVDTVGSLASSSRSIGSRKSQDTGEYKMSVVNDSGVYLPPSPTERDSFWAASSRRYLARSSTEHSRHGGGAGAGLTAGPNAAAIGAGDTIEPFSISRESFDSYRRSFDISARSPVVGGGSEWGAAAAVPGRQSLDSAAFRKSSLRTPQRQQQRGRGTHLRSGLSSVNGDGAAGPASQPQRFPPADEGFEDVGLDQPTSTGGSGSGSSNNNNGSTAANFIRKHGGFFAKFGSDHAEGTEPSPLPPVSSAPTTTPAVSRFLLSSRKRAQSGQGAELAAMDGHSRPTTATSSTEAQEGAVAVDGTA
ncbi:hypothetical protein SPI_02952 [Niveomyces insectorum RCEF 264]|uniref:Uncharacterized protein n=1 Tax=Niveomyces insectorum RCEF 264 TaxID=1081102 RepID=A0A167WXV5_9HYPO|nr:hypothetical protein SPI_02952 [Niveomyces insectorum RCEF 264]